MTLTEVSQKSRQTVPLTFYADYTERSKNLIQWMEKITTATVYSFLSLVPRQLQHVKEVPGVYMISNIQTKEVLYIGQTTNLQRRMYTNQLMGNINSSSIKRFLSTDQLLKEFISDSGERWHDPEESEDHLKKNVDLAKQYLKEKCQLQFVVILDARERTLIRNGLSYALNVRFIENEQ